MFDVTVLGSIAVDHIIYIDEIPAWDETRIVNAYMVEAGGSAANVAYILARLGFKAAFHGKVGGDYWGRFSLNSLSNAGVDISGAVVDEKLRTAQAFILVNKDGMKIIFVSAGEGFALSPELKDVKYYLIDDSRAVYIGEVFLEVAEAVAKYAKKIGRKVVYRVLTPYARMGYSKLKRVFPYVDLLVLNSRSWEFLKASGAQIKNILDLGLEYVIVTLGDRGCSIYGEDKVRFISSVKTGKVVDTTGCGDAFTAGLIAKLLKGWTITEAARYGAKIASWAASEIGARKGIDKFISENNL